MAKVLFFYSDINGTTASASTRTIVAASGVPYTELVLGRDARLHNVTIPGINVVIEVDGKVWKELLPSSATELLAAWNAAPTSAPVVLSTMMPSERDGIEAASLVERHQASLTPLETIRLNQLILKGLLKLTGGKL